MQQSATCHPFTIHLLSRNWRWTSVRSHCPSRIRAGNHHVGRRHTFRLSLHVFLSPLAPYILSPSTSGLLLRPSKPCNFGFPLHLSTEEEFKTSKLVLLILIQCSLRACGIGETSSGQNRTNVCEMGRPLVSKVRSCCFRPYCG